MNTQFILLTQSVTGAVIEIILLLLVAGLIGFFTAWFYQKSYFTPIIKKLESEKDELNRKIDGLNNEIAGLKVKISDLEKAIAEKDRVIAAKNKEIEELRKPKKEQ